MGVVLVVVMGAGGDTGGRKGTTAIMSTIKVKKKDNRILAKSVGEPVRSWLVGWLDGQILSR